ncbi:extracellular solute-binding protein [Saccharibacillus sp. CPCC 101409]|uniref:extracellular solute-binding protein n=1 Tax=Saccharibacillus sp. CPCC 101409 TaxID=3058041 RepID=UPI002670E2A0|nr:extracellular solute-binding protein [Saccharibacillus sp. CPCC 101409]MDO3408928.1 extracellular solute-binding protein [Saccharibacillus sp. CPCC 101409]
MRRNWKKAAMSLTVIAAMTLGGCASGGDKDEASSKGETSGQTVSKEGFPIVEQPIKLQMFTRIAPVNGPFKDMPVFQDYEKTSNIQTEFIESPTDGFQEKKNLLFASNELPDVMYRSGISALEAVRYGSGGQLIPLEDMLADYAPNFSKLMDEYPEIRAAITTPEGHIYTLPGIVTLDAARTDKKWINKSWLDKLGLEEPQTIDELYDVLVAFRDGDPNGNGKKDELPMTARSGLSIVPLMSGSYGLDQQFGYNINIADDKVEIWMGSERNKELLMFLNKLYAENLLDRDLFAHTEAQFLAKQGTGNTGMFFDQTNNNFLPIADQYVGIAPPEGPHGDRLQAQGAPVPRDAGAFAITSVNKYPEASLRWVDYFYTDEGSTLLRFGREGEHYEIVDGIPQYKPEYSTADTQPKLTPYAGGGAPHLISEYVASYINPPQVQEAQKKLDPYMPEIRYAAPMFDEATAQKVNMLRNDIDKYYEEQSTKFIAGALSFDKWDEFQSTLKKMNIEELQQIYQDAYDKMEK